MTKIVQISGSKLTFLNYVCQMRKTTECVCIVICKRGNNDGSKSCFHHSKIETSKGCGTAHNSPEDYYNSKVLLRFIHFSSYLLRHVFQLLL
jgi:hypothetical protein